MENNNLSELISLAKFGDVICINTGITGAPIRWWTNSGFNHTAIYLYDGLILDSTLKYGVKIRKIEELGNFEWALLRCVQKIDFQAN